jgi:hypothetical protein
MPRKRLQVYLTGISIICLLLGVIYNNTIEYETLEKENENLYHQKGSYAYLYKEMEQKYNFLNDINGKLMKENEELKQHNEELSNSVEASIEDFSSNFKNYGGSFKSFTDYRALGKSTPNYRLCASASVDNDGLLIKDDAYLVAMGSGWNGKLGSVFMIFLDTGESFKVMLCDVKADKDTDDSNKYTVSNGCMLEFYVDRHKLNKNANKCGDISKISKFKGSIIGVIKIS